MIITTPAKKENGNELNRCNASGGDEDKARLGTGVQKYEKIACQTIFHFDQPSFPSFSPRAPFFRATSVVTSYTETLKSDANREISRPPVGGRTSENRRRYTINNEHYIAGTLPDIGRVTRNRDRLGRILCHFF